MTEQIESSFYDAFHITKGIKLRFKERLLKKIFRKKINIAVDFIHQVLQD